MRATSGPALTSRWLGPVVLAVGALACDSSPQPLWIANAAPVFRGHQDLFADGDKTPIPWVLGKSGSIGFCVEAPPAKDTSQWDAQLFVEGSYSPPTVRLDTTVCFETPTPEGQREGTERLCAELRDRFDGLTQRLPCLSFRFDADDGKLRELEQAIPAALGKVARLDTLAVQARTNGFHALALRLQLIAVYTLRREGSEPARAEAARRLETAPAWIDLPAAARWAGQLAYERATLRLETDADLAGCWRLLRTAEHGLRASGERKWIAVVAKQAEVLARAGALAEAKARLRFGLDQCASAPCDRPLVRAAENTLAWMVISDPDASDAELAEADRSLASLLSKDEAPDDPLERANLLVNLAFTRERSGAPFEPELESARGLIGTAASARARELGGWADLVDGRHALRTGAASRAAAVCDRLGESGASARLQGFGWSCAAAAYRRSGALERATDRLVRALALDAASGANRLGQAVPLSPGQRAEDVYAAARVQLEAGHADAAWTILRELDDEATAPVEPATLEPWLKTLDDLEKPSSAARRAQQKSVRFGTLDRMQEALRASPLPARPDSTDATVTFRAFPLDNEIVLLHRQDDETITVYRRTPLPRSRLVDAVRAVNEAIARGEPDDARWVALVEPLAEALAPRREDLGTVTTFATHGILQEVPLAALPVRSGDSATQFLGELTTVAWHPSGAQARERATQQPGDAVFVSDPLGDLGVANERAAGPAGNLKVKVLWRDAATRAALQAALANARWLHVDAHARYEPAFPELSTILLADGPVTGQELSAWGANLELANLSACESSRFPVTADSGRFGLAGLLARRGVTWVAGARAALPNALAIDFNRAFYASLAEGDDVPAAYRRALDTVRRRYPASQWANLVLLRANSEEPQGQSGAPRTPSLSGGVQ